MTSLYMRLLAGLDEIRAELIALKKEVEFPHNERMQPMPFSDADIWKFSNTEAGAPRDLYVRAGKPDHITPASGQAGQRVLLPEKPTIVCLCGSTRFSQAFQDANYQETLAGKIVLTIGCDFKSDSALGLTQEDKARLDQLHLRKIDMADEVLVLNVGGYLGESTLNEIKYAKALGKRIRSLEPLIAPIEAKHRPACEISQDEAEVG